MALPFKPEIIMAGLRADVMLKFYLANILGRDSETVWDEHVVPRACEPVIDKETGCGLVDVVLERLSDHIRANAPGAPHYAIIFPHITHVERFCKDIRDDDGRLIESQTNKVIVGKGNTQDGAGLILAPSAFECGLEAIVGSLEVTFRARAMTQEDYLYAFAPVQIYADATVQNPNLF